MSICSGEALPFVSVVGVVLNCAPTRNEFAGEEARRDKSHLADMASLAGVGRGYLRADAGRVHALRARVAGANGLVHATPTGMAKYPGLPLPAALLRPAHWIAEIVYFPLDTALLQAARRRGCRVADGGGMAVFQAVGAFRLFTGIEPDAGSIAERGGHFGLMNMQQRAEAIGAILDARRAGRSSASLWSPSSSSLRL